MGEIQIFLNLIEYEKVKMSRYNDSIIILEKLVGFAQELDYPVDFIFKLTEYLYSKCQDNKSETYHNSLKLLASINFDSNFKYSLLYIKFLDQVNTKNIDVADITIYINLVQYCINIKDLDNCFEIINIGEKFKFKLSNDLKTSILLFDFFKMLYLVEIGQREEPKKIALDILNELKIFEDQYLKNIIIRQAGIQNIINYCQNTLSNLRKNIAIQSSKKIGRNDMVKVKYDNDKEIIIKYKKVEIDLKNGKCKLVN